MIKIYLSALFPAWTVFRSARLVEHGVFKIFHRPPFPHKLVEFVALRQTLPAKQALARWQHPDSPHPTLLSPDAALGDGLARSASQPTTENIS